MSEDAVTLFHIFSLLLPAALYAMGLMEGRKGRASLAVALLLHLAAMLLRGLELGTMPLTEKHDTISFMAFSTAALYWYQSRRAVPAVTGLLALPFVAGLLCVAAAYEPINTIPPFQRSLWFYLHMFFSFGSYGFIALSACSGLAYLSGRNQGDEQDQYRGAAIGWVLYSFALIAGSIWFFAAYGTYWLWTSRELWTALAWFFLSLYLHARMMKGFRGIPVSVLGIAAFAIMLFTYFGVGRVIPSPPTQF